MGVIEGQPQDLASAVYAPPARDEACTMAATVPGTAATLLQLGPQQQCGQKRQAEEQVGRTSELRVKAPIMSFESEPASSSG